MLGSLPVIGGFILTPFQQMMMTRSVELSNDKMKRVLGIEPVSLEESVRYGIAYNRAWAIRVSSFSVNAFVLVLSMQM